MNFEQTVNMLNQLAAPYHRELNDWEVRRWVEELRAVKEPVALAAMRRVHSRDEKFPSMARFLETVKSMRGGEGNREVELEPGLWLPLKDLLDELEAEKRDWERVPMTDEQRILNQRKLDEIWVERFGVRRRRAI